jgi:hypothetical protein
MVGYMYWQQNKVMSVVSSLSSFVASQFVPAPLETEDSEEEDDRASVLEEKNVEVVDTVEVPTVPVSDVDDLQEKTSSELRDLLSKKGIPYGKRDSKTVLLQLLKASA